MVVVRWSMSLVSFAEGRIPRCCMGLSNLVELDDLQVVAGLDKPSFVHTDHRWMLPIVHYAQERSWLPRPCTLVLFDEHHDALPPRNLKELQRACGQPLTPEHVVQICKTILSPLDDDWITAGMDLGLFDGAIVFGVRQMGDLEGLRSYRDISGIEHQLFFPSLPGRALGYQGELSDRARATQFVGFQEDGTPGFQNLSPRSCPVRVTVFSLS